MLVTIITLFPGIFENIFNYSIIKRAKEKGKIQINFINLRDFGMGTHKTVDDRPYGGGAGMIIRVDVLEHAISKARKNLKWEKVALLDPRGKTYNQSIAEKISELDHLILVCGHYEGFDERIRKLIDIEISIGDFVLTGGEIPAMLIIDSIVRLIPGVLKKEEAAKIESFSKIDKKRLIEYPQYTRPEIYKDLAVPKILLSGNHKKVLEYQKKEALRITSKNRPDLLK